MLWIFYAHISELVETSPWTDCSTTCGGGTKYRIMTCTKDDQEVDISECGRGVVANQTLLCNKKRCNGKLDSLYILYS